MIQVFLFNILFSFDMFVIFFFFFNQLGKICIKPGDSRWAFRQAN